MAPDNWRSLAARPLACRIYFGAVRRLNLAAWSAWTVLSRKRPRILLTFGGGLGDHLLCTTIFRELRQRGERDLWMASNHRALFAHNEDVDRVVPLGRFFADWTSQSHGRIVPVTYTAHIKEQDRDVPPQRHISACLCEMAGLSGNIQLRPYLTLGDHEARAGRVVPRQIAIQSSGLAAQYPMRNKEWYPERFQQVVDALSGDYQFVQVGSAGDPLLTGTRDMRGKTSIRQTAAILSQSLVFIGQVGFLMHLARAVDCRAVIVYGGRELPEQSGYICNENLTTALPCAPCWKWNECPYERECMRRIDATQVVAAVERQLRRQGTPLETAIDSLPAAGVRAIQ